MAHVFSSRNMFATVSGRPLLLQPFTSLHSMAMGCLVPASTARRAHAAVHDTGHLTHVHHGAPVAQASNQAGRHGTHQSVAATGSMVGSHRSAVASAAELDVYGEQFAQPTALQRSARRHQMHSLAGGTAVIGWRVRDATALNQDIGTVREVGMHTYLQTFQVLTTAAGRCLASIMNSCTVRPPADHHNR
jgi:hypothetical protein